MCTPYSDSLRYTTRSPTMSEPLSNIEKELAELVEEETTGLNICWNNIMSRASLPLQKLMELEVISEGFTLQPLTDRKSVV